jgi:hypothetical protein
MCSEVCPQLEARKSVGPRATRCYYYVQPTAGAKVTSLVPGTIMVGHAASNQ